MIDETTKTKELLGSFFSVVTGSVVTGVVSELEVLDSEVVVVVVELVELTTLGAVVFAAVVPPPVVGWE